MDLKELQVIASSKNTFRNVLLVIVGLLLLSLAMTCNRNSRQAVDLNISKQNEKALSDSVRISINKVGEVEYSKNILVADIGDLEKLNKNLFDEMKKEKGKVSELTSTIISIKNKNNDTVILPSKLIEYSNGDRGISWEYDTIYDAKNYRRISGVSNFKINFTKTTYNVMPLNTNIIKFDIGFNIVQGLRETKNGDVEMFVRSNHPGFEVSDLSSVIINPENNPILKKFTTSATVKNKRFGIGINAGYGIYVDGKNNTAGTGIIAGFGLSYSLFRF